MKKLFFIAAMVVLALAGCSKGGDGNDTPAETDTGDAPVVTNNVNIQISQSNSVANIQKAIQDALDWVGTVATTQEEHTIYVTGSKTSGVAKLTLEAKGGPTDWAEVLLKGGQLTITGLELKGVGERMIAFSAKEGGRLTVNGDVAMTSGSYCGIYVNGSGSEASINGNVTCNGDADFDLDATSDGKFTVTGNVTATGNVDDDRIIWSSGEFTIGGNLSAQGDIEAISIGEGGKVTIKGNVSAPNGFLCRAWDGGGTLTVDGTVTVADATTRFINSQPKAQYLQASSDKAGYTQYAGSDWKVYLKQ